MQKKKKRKNSAFNYASISNIAFQMIAIILIGVFSGVYFDKLINIDFPICTLSLTILSLIMAMYILITKTTR